jgi:flavorubredoxin
MAYIKLKNNVYSVGVLNPSMRIFDVEMKTEFGTSYNAYAVIGNEKTALIDTNHLNFFDVYLDNLKDANINKVDYIVLNHTEPDHSGSLFRLLEIFPDAKIVGTPAAKIYLKNITNRELDFITVKDGDTLDLGDKTLEFRIAPFLHWPDSMFTYLKEDNILFTCDFLGTHFCEPTMWSDKILYKKEYDSAFLNYYNAIFSPFKEFVLKGLAKMSDINPDFVCTSHGPILIGQDITKAKELYTKWSTSVIKDKKTISIFYASAYSCTKSLAFEIEKGIKSVLDCNTKCYDVNDFETSYLADILNNSDAVLFGSPTINKDAVKPINALLYHIDAINTKCKSATAFGSFGWSGEAVPLMIERLRGLKFKVNYDGYKINFVPSVDQLNDAFNFGAEFANDI